MYRGPTVWLLDGAFDSIKEAIQAGPQDASAFARGLVRLYEIIEPRWSEATDGQLKPGDYRLPTPQSQAVFELLLGPTTDPLARSSLAMEWVNIGPSSAALEEECIVCRSILEVEGYTIGCPGCFEHEHAEEPETEHGVRIPTDGNGRPLRDAPGRYCHAAGAMGARTEHTP